MLRPKFAYGDLFEIHVLHNNLFYINLGSRSTFFCSEFWQRRVNGVPPLATWPCITSTSGKYLVFAEIFYNVVIYHKRLQHPHL